ncbi:MAG: prepilin-type N-terminal cleavage/methylation domain-containing protein [Arcobacteraceae bacterium]|jgi:general secretion pathway protein G|nr:prepilin-type N-terminal cleavage/methylation domain-containing protein [Arcobacteraceae bacterium]
MINKTRKLRAFSLIELIFAIVVIAIIASVAIPKLMGINSKAKTSTVSGDVSTIISSIQSYHMVNKKIDKISDSVTLNPSVWNISDKEVIYKENAKDCIKITVDDDSVSLSIDETAGTVCGELYTSGIRNEVFVFN